MPELTQTVDIEIPPEDVVSIVGKRKSGKTTIAANFLADEPRLIALDVIGDLHTQLTNTEPYSENGLRELQKGGVGRLIITPPKMPAKEMPQWFDDFIEPLNDMGNFILYIDEAYSVLPVHLQLLANTNALFTRGRHYGIGVWVSMQRPAIVNNFVLSQAAWILAFRVNLPDDKRKLREMMGEYEYPEDPHGFWFWSDDDPNPQYFPNHNR